MEKRGLSEALGKRHDISALLVIAARPGISPSRLARDMGASQPPTGQAMSEHLSKFGLISVRTAPGVAGKDNDYIELSPKGHALVRALRLALKVMGDIE